MEHLNAVCKMKPLLNLLGRRVHETTYIESTVIDSIGRSHIRNWEEELRSLENKILNARNIVYTPSPGMPRLSTK